MACGAASSPRATLKRDVLESVKLYRPGSSETSVGEARRDILRKLELLEGSNEASTSEIRAGLQGRWVLLYQAPLKDDERLSDYEKKAVTVEGPFLSAFKPFTRDLFRTLSNTQNIRVDEERIENVAEFRVAGRWTGRLNILGSVVLGRDGDEDEESRRAYVEFSSFELSFGDGAPLSVPVGKLSELLGKLPPRGWLLTTYLDEDVRVGRGDKGSIFVAKRMRG